MMMVNNQQWDNLGRIGSFYNEQFYPSTESVIDYREDGF